MSWCWDIFGRFNKGYLVEDENDGRLLFFNGDEFMFLFYCIFNSIYILFIYSGL